VKRFGIVEEDLGVWFIAGELRSVLPRMLPTMFEVAVEGSATDKFRFGANKHFLFKMGPNSRLT
jgi:hypothetical protein